MSETHLGSVMGIILKKVNTNRSMRLAIFDASTRYSPLANEYDFADRSEHEVVFEGCLPTDQSLRYPLCLEGERALPIIGYELRIALFQSCAGGR